MADRSSRTRRKSCASCTESKIKCDRQHPCSKCTSKGKECVFSSSRRKSAASNQPVQQSLLRYDKASSETSSSSSSLFIPAPEAVHSYSSPFHIEELEENGSSGMFMPSIAEEKPFLSVQPSSTVDSYPSDVDTIHDSEHLLPVHSHLSSVYASDMFEPFFSNIFSRSTSTAPIADLSWPESLGQRTSSPEEFPFPTLTPSIPEHHEAGADLEVSSGAPPLHASPTLRPATSDIRHTPAADNMYTSDPAAPELQHYCR